MKKLFTLMVVVAFNICALSQVPEKMSYQAIIRNANNVLITNQVIGMRISILHSSLTGTPVYVETQNPTTNVNGLVTLEIGGGTPVSGTFATIDWSAGSYFIKTETDPSGGTSYTIIGTSQLLSVPYALYAGNGISNSVLDGLKLQIKALEDNLIASGTYKLIDIEGNQYKVVKIGNQVWMAENLKVTHFSDGTSIPHIVEGLPGYCWYNNDSSIYKETYGALYNWVAVYTYKLCPTGWHVPSDSEWGTLRTFLGGDPVAGGKLKETGTTHWNTPNTGATNETGFTALPGGMYTDNGPFSGIGTDGYWWTGNKPTLADCVAYYVQLYYNQSNSYSPSQPCYNALSIRCVKDAGPILTTDSVTATRTDIGMSHITTVKSGGHIIDDNGLVITHKGICWSSSPGTGYNGSCTDEGGGSDNFKSTFTQQYNGVALNPTPRNGV
jgi:uncharacterized protein (TIGR02145 family)